jgi:hypothetical protein
MKLISRTLIASLCITAGACNDSVDKGVSAIDVSKTTIPDDLRGVPSFAVQVSEFGQATGVTLLDGDGQIVEERYLSTGDEAPVLGAALASDIALPTTPCDPDLVTVVGRQGANNILQVDYRTGEVVRQVSAQRDKSNAEGAYQSNPQDVLCLAGDRAIVSRANPNLLPGAAALDLGDDLVVLDLAGGDIAERIALDEFRATVGEGKAEELAYARPGSIVRRGKRAVVGLSVYSLSYVAAVPGKLALLDLDTLDVSAIALEKLANCGTVVPVADRDDAVIASCAGSPYGDAATAGLALVSVSQSGEAVVEAEFQEAFEGAALYAAPTSLGGSRVLAVAMDALYTAPDVAYVVDVVAGSVEKAFEGTVAGGIGSGTMRSDTGLVLVPDTGIGVRLFTAEAGSLTELESVALDTSVPPRAIRPLRQL